MKAIRASIRSEDPAELRDLRTHLLFLLPCLPFLLCLLLSLTPEPGWFDEPLASSSHGRRPRLPPLPPPLRAANYYFRDPELTPLSEDPPKPAPPSKASKVQNQNCLERAPLRPRSRIAHCDLSLSACLVVYIAKLPPPPHRQVQHLLDLVPRHPS